MVTIDEIKLKIKNAESAYKKYHDNKISIGENEKSASTAVARRIIILNRMMIY